MKKNMPLCSIVLIGILTIFNVSAAIAQTYEGNLVLTSQAEVDAFNYSEVTGSLTISGDDIVTLGPLSVLTSIGTYLSMGDNPSLLIVEDAFPNLTGIGGGINFYRTKLVRFSGFDALLSTGDNIDFWFNDSLVTVTGFGALQTAGWSLEFGGNPVLTEIPEFESLQTIPSSLFILDNLLLPGISGFNALQHVDWSFQIGGNASLDNLCGFYNYFSVNNPYTGGGAIDIVNNHPELPNPMGIQDILDAGVCIITPVQQIEQLISDIQAMGLRKGVENKLLKALVNVQKSLASSKLVTATNQLDALLRKIEFLERRGKIDGGTADELVAAVLAIIDAINS